MSRLKIHNDVRQPGDDFYAPSGMTAYGTQIFLDGQEVHGCRGVDLHVHLDDIVTATVEVIATDSLDVEIDAAVMMNITVEKGYELQETTLPDGRRLLRAVKLEVPV